MSWLWGKTGYSFFDVWSIVHFAVWIFVGSVVYSIKYSPTGLMAGCLAAAYSWEVFERYAEKRWPNLWLNPESWWNSLLSDPLMCGLGVAFVWYALSHWRSVQNPV